MALTDYRADAMRCTRCSYCKWIPFDLVQSHRFAKGCPSVEAGKFHSYSAGGKLITALSLMDGRSEATDQLVDVAFRCQLCGNCDVACKLCRYDMEPILALRELRAHLVAMDRVPDSYRPLIERTRAALAGKGPKTPADRNAWAEGLGLADPAAEPVDVVFYAGCKYSLEESLRETVRTQVRLLQHRRPQGRPVRERLLRRPRRQDGLPRRGRRGRRADAQAVGAGRRQDRGHPVRRLPPRVHARLPEARGRVGGHAADPPHRRVRRPADQGRAARARHARPHDGHLPRPLQPRPAGRALPALGGRREEDLRPGRGLRPAAAAAQRRERRLPARRATCSPPSPAWSSSRWSAAARPPGAAAPAAPAARPSPSTRRRPPPSASRRPPPPAPKLWSRACSRCELNFAEAVAADAASGGPGADLQVHDVLELVALSAGVAKEAS